MQVSESGYHHPFRWRGIFKY